MRRNRVKSQIPIDNEFAIIVIPEFHEGPLPDSFDFQVSNLINYT